MSEANQNECSSMAFLELASPKFSNGYGFFFEEVCGWTHGVEFVSLASQHTMTALIGGFTIHSFGNVRYRQKDGSLANAHKGD